jgi:hypothetical protein
VAERLHERELAVDRCVTLLVGQLPDALDGVGPRCLERLPRGAQTVGMGGSHPRPEWEPRVVLVHVGGDIDTVDEQSVDLAVDGDVDAPDGREPRPGEVDVAERRSGEIDSPERGVAQVTELELFGHRSIMAPSPERPRRDRRARHRGGYSRSIDTAMPGKDTHGCLSTHHASTVGFTVDLSSRVPAFTAMMPADKVISDRIGEPQLPQNRRRT